MFAQILTKSLIDLYAQDSDFSDTLMIDEQSKLNSKLISKSTIIFKGFLVTTQDIDDIIEKLDQLHKRNLTILSLFCNPVIVSEILKNYPNVKFYSVFNSVILTKELKGIIQGGTKEDYSDQVNCFGITNLTNTFRKVMMDHEDI